MGGLIAGQTFVYQELAEVQGGSKTKALAALQMAEFWLQASKIYLPAYTLEMERAQRALSAVYKIQRAVKKLPND